MSTSSGTSTPGTPSAGLPVQRTGLSQSSPRTRFDEAGHSPYASDAAGRSYTSDSTEEESGTCISDECSLEFLISDTDRHPSRIICTTHDWTGEVTEGV